MRRAADKVDIAAAQGMFLPYGAQAVAGLDGKVRHLFRLHTLLLGAAENGACQRVLALTLQQIGQAHQFIRAYTLGRQDIRHPGLARGDRARLVQRHNLDAPGFLQGCGGLKQNAILRAQAVAYHDGYRRCQTQRAGAADHQHRNAARQRIANALAQQQPHKGSHCCNGDHRGHKYARHLIGNLGNGGLGGRRVADHADDLRQGGILTHTGSAALEEARLVERSGRHAVARRLIHRDALARQGRFVHRAAAFDNHAVHRDVLAGTHHKDIPHAHLGNGHGLLAVAAQHIGSLWRQAHQPLERIGGFSLGTGFQHLAHGNQSQDHGGRLEIKVHHIGHDRVHIAAHLGARHGKKRIGAVAKGRRRAQRHQRIHIGRAVPQALKTADKEALVNDHHHSSQQQLSQAHSHMVVIVEGGQRPAPHHMTHGEVHQHNQKAQRPDEPPLEGRRIVIL